MVVLGGGRFRMSEVPLQSFGLRFRVHPCGFLRSCALPRGNVEAMGAMALLLICDATVELIHTLGALFPRGGPVQDPVPTLPPAPAGVARTSSSLLLSSLELSDTEVYEP